MSDPTATPPIFDAILRRDLPRLRELAVNEANLRQRWSPVVDERSFYAGLTPLMVAALVPGEMAETVRTLLEAGASPADRSPFGARAAWYAAGAGSLGPLPDAIAPAEVRGDYAERLRLLLEGGADPGESAAYGKTLVTEAASAGDPTRLRVLLAFGASALPSTDIPGPSDPMLPRLGDDLDSEFMESLRPIPDRHFGFAIPLFAAAEAGSAESVKLLLEAGSPVDLRDESDHTALHYAAASDVVHLLVKAGLDPNDVGPWRHALEQERYDVAAALLDSGLDPNLIDHQGWSLLHLTAFDLQPEGVRLLVERGADLTWRTEGERTPLHAAAWRGDGNGGITPERNERTIRELVAAGLDPHARDIHGQVPLHDAAGGDWGSPTSVRTLLQLGATSDPVDDTGITPLMLASDRGEVESIELLLQAGANPLLADHEDRTAIDRALQHVETWHDLRAAAERAGDPHEREYASHALREAERALGRLEKAGTGG